MSRNRMDRGRGFTLVELLVAIALMVILTGSVVFIFIQAQKIFLTVDARVQVYQYARYAFDQIERDVANVVHTANMEFFDDLPPPTGTQGRFDPGEYIPISGTEYTPQGFYTHALTLRQPTLYDAVDGRKYRHDSLYFKTVTTSGGETSAALVEYALTDRQRERPRLVRRIWRVTGVDAMNPVRPRFKINGGNAGQAEPLENDLCLYTMDCQMALFARNRRLNQVGRFYTAEEFLNPPRMGPGNQKVFEPTRDYWDGAEGLMIQTLYDERHDQNRAQPDFGVFDPAEGGLFRTEDYFTFPMLREGDRIFISGGGLPKPKEFTIKAFVKPDGTPYEPGDPTSAMRILFHEPVEWPTSQQGNTLKVRYAAAWLPPAVRVTLKIKDSKSLELRTVERVFKILSSN